jgi:hypothetical protein
VGTIAKEAAGRVAERDESQQAKSRSTKYGSEETVDREINVRGESEASGKNQECEGGSEEMNRKYSVDRRWCCILLLMLTLVSDGGLLAAQSSTDAGKSNSSASTAALEKEFFSAIRDGDTAKFLSYVPSGGINFGPQPVHMTRDDVEQQLLSRHGLYCKLFDSSCIDASINLENSGRVCSYRELLTHSDKVNTAASEITRSGVRQAVLVARIKNDQCSGPKLVDFIFNFEAGWWNLFSIP